MPSATHTTVPTSDSAPPASAAPLTPTPPAGPAEAQALVAGIRPVTKWEPGVVIGRSTLVRPAASGGWVVRCLCGRERVMDPSVLARRVASGALGRCGRCAHADRSSGLARERAARAVAAQGIVWPRDVLRDLVAEIEAESRSASTRTSPAMRSILERAKRVLA